MSRRENLKKVPVIGALVTFWENDLNRSVFWLLLSGAGLVKFLFFPFNSLLNYLGIFGFATIFITNLIRLIYILWVDNIEPADKEKYAYAKKYPTADINRAWYTLFAIGLVLTLGILVSAFNWTKKDYKLVDLGTIEVEEEFEVEPPPTKQEKPPPPPPPPPQIEVVEEELLEEEEPDIDLDIEVDVEEEIEMPEITEEETGEEEIFTIVEDMPRFPGCEHISNKEERQRCAEMKLLEYLAKCPYPPIARENDIEGQVLVKFVIEKDGSVTNVEVIRGADKILNEAAVNHIKNMPKWIPGQQRGRPVRVQFVVPIRFKLS